MAPSQVESLRYTLLPNGLFNPGRTVYRMAGL